MDESSKKLLKEKLLKKKKLLKEKLLKECWHDNTEVHPYPDHPEDFYSRCRTCNVNEYHENRTFLTWDDLGACKDALVREGLWLEFIRYVNPVYYNSLRYSEKNLDLIYNFMDWLFRPVNEAGEAHFCALVVQFLEAKDGQNREFADGPRLVLREWDLLRWL